ncbi:multidrug effflux MFS transporter [Aquamicrobium sp. LC103]|uniref:multidrug effflux MFS transporter n=1 Tax=Aquamicrobium sp. LC103 TaxID=1120658 RepID=UPI0010C9B334|nr:multidrug effflux MFS transporter [Aquamicrobium sp. LC103]TKT79172.1 multidrug effflux MFS transporter [Aquamicrobium sp. LC103]
MSDRLSHRLTPPHILTLVIATATGTLAMNVFLPSLPGMARHFDVDYGVMQLAVSLYLAATALLQLAIGPASDRFGRRPVMLSCFGIFLLGSLGALYAPTVEFLLLARMLQAFSAAGMVLSRAIVRDTVGTDQAASKIGYITMGMALVPMIAPVVGGFLDELYGWHANFIMILVCGMLSFVIVYLDLGETNHNRSASLLSQVGSYPELFRSRRFWGYTATAAFASGTFFAFLGGGPYVATQILGLRPSEYGLYFAILSCGYMLGNFLSGRYSRRLGINTMMLSGNIVAALGMAVSLLLFAFGYHHAIAVFGPVALVGVGNGMTLPNANAGLVSVRPHLAGSASGLGGALQIGGGAALSVVAGALLSPTSGPTPLLWVMFISSLLAVFASLYVVHVARRAGSI